MNPLVVNIIIGIVCLGLGFLDEGFRPDLVGFVGEVLDIRGGGVGHHHDPDDAVLARLR